MTTLLQEPVAVDIREIVNQYGSHFSTLPHSFKNNPSNRIFKYPIAVFESIGEKDTINIWKQEHTNVAEAIKSAQESIVGTMQKNVKLHERSADSFIGKFISFRHKFGLFSQGTSERIQDYKNQYEAALHIVNNPPEDIDVVYLQGMVNIPKYIPIKNKDYFLLNISGNSTKITRVQVSSVDIYDYRGSKSSDSLLDQYDFYLNHHFSEVDKEDGVSETVEFSNLIRYDGSYLKASCLGSYIFENESDAVEFAVKDMDHKINKMEVELAVMKARQAELINNKNS